MTKPDRDISKLNKHFLLKVTAFMQDQRVKEIGIIITEAVRSNKRQAELYASGASKVEHSNHQDSMAVDFCFSGTTAYPSTSDPKWKTISDIATEYGIDSGLKLWNWDFCHLQNGNIPLTKVNMYDSFENILEAAISINSALWKTTFDEDLKKKLEEMNKYLRTLRK